MSSRLESFHLGFSRVYHSFISSQPIEPPVDFSKPLLQTHTLTAVITREKEGHVAELMPGMGFPLTEWEERE